MHSWHCEKAQVGDELPSLTIKPINRTALVLYAGASGDYNSIHIDSTFAKNEGLSDVFSHGMLVMSFVGRVVTNAVPQNELRQFSVTFTSITHLKDELTCYGRVARVEINDHEKSLFLEVKVFDQEGDVKLKGEVLVVLMS